MKISGVGNLLTIPWILTNRNWGLIMIQPATLGDPPKNDVADQRWGCHQFFLGYELAKDVEFALPTPDGMYRLSSNMAWKIIPTSSRIFPARNLHLYPLSLWISHCRPCLKKTSPFP
jgi:hypothetical protein